MILTYIEDICKENDQHSPDFPKHKEKEIVNLYNQVPESSQNIIGFLSLFTFILGL
jgi:hypothetical protein